MFIIFNKSSKFVRSKKALSPKFGAANQCMFSKLQNKFIAKFSDDVNFYSNATVNERISYFAPIFAQRANDVNNICCQQDVLTSPYCSCNCQQPFHLITKRIFGLHVIHIWVYLTIYFIVQIIVCMSIYSQNTATDDLSN